jgi:hypothetical protein
MKDNTWYEEEFKNMQKSRTEKKIEILEITNFVSQKKFRWHPNQ